MRKKQIYEAPEAEAILVNIERNFCASPLGEDTISANGYRDEYKYRDL